MDQLTTPLLSESSKFVSLHYFQKLSIHNYISLYQSLIYQRGFGFWVLGLYVLHNPKTPRKELWVLKMLENKLISQCLPRRKDSVFCFHFFESKLSTWNYPLPSFILYFVSLFLVPALSKCTALPLLSNSYEILHSNLLFSICFVF